MSNLSPQAQAVLDAMYEVNMDFGEVNANLAAAALRALVDACSFEDFNTRLISASDVIAIATELDTL